MNQYVKAREQGLEPGDEGWPKQAEKRPPMSDRTKAKISESQIVNKMIEMFEDENLPPSVRAQIGGKLLDKVVPTLSSVDSTLVNKNEVMSEEQLVAKLRVLVENNPELVSKIMGDNARGKGGISGTQGKVGLNTGTDG